MSLEPEQGAFVFFSYAQQDKRLRDRLEDHLSNLKYQGIITTWHEHKILAGEKRTQQIDIYLDKAHIILLLISSHFLASEYCYGREMGRALERYERREADVIPILLRSVHFKGAPFAKLQMLPSNKKPVMRWRDRDDAFYDIACGIERVALKYSPTIPTPVIPQNKEGRLRDEILDWGLVHIETGGHLLFPFALVIVLLVISFVAASILTLLQHPILILLFVALLLLIAGVIVVFKTIRARIKQKRAYYEKAIAAYQEALRQNPRDENACRGMGNALFALKRYDEALDAFQQAIQCKPTSAAYAGLGNTFAKLKRYSEAVAACKKAIKLDPTVTLNYDDFIRSLRVLGREKEAKQVRVRAKQLGYEEDD